MRSRNGRHISQNTTTKNSMIELISRPHCFMLIETTQDDDMKTEDKPYLTTQEAAQILGYAEQTLHQSRKTGRLGGADAPPFLKRGRMVRYVRSDLDSWLTGGQ